MKKVILASLMPVLLAGSFSAFAEDSVTVDGGKINFTCAIVAAPCAVDNTSDGQTITPVRTDQESLYYFNTKAIPAMDKKKMEGKNILLLAA